jgi:hypothetical protein
MAWLLRWLNTVKTSLSVIITVIVEAEVLASVTFLLFGIMVPVGILYLYWNKQAEEFIAYFHHVLYIANDRSKLSELILIIVPLGLISCLSSNYFMIRNRHLPWSDSFLFRALFIPTVLLVVAQLVLLYYVYSFQDQVLRGDHLSLASTGVYTSMICLFWIEGFMAWSRAAERAQMSLFAPSDSVRRHPRSPRPAK